MTSPHRSNRSRRAVALFAAAWLATAALYGGDRPEPGGPDLGPVSEWIAAQSAVKSARGTFVQERRLRTLKRPVVKTGSFCYQAPDRLRWQVGEGDDALVAVKTPEGVSVARPGEGTVERFAPDEIESDDRLRTLAYIQAGFPTSLTEFQTTFEVTAVAREDGRHLIESRLRRGRDAAFLRKITFSIDAETHRLAGLEISFRDGSSVAVRFEGVETDLELPEGTFDLAEPSGGAAGAVPAAGARE